MNIVQTTHDCPLIHKLLQAYEKEFSPITGKRPDQRGVYPLDVDLSTTSNYLCNNNEEIIGFCVKGTTSGRHDILEFYIIPEERNNGRGEQLAHAIFQMHKGPWQVRQIRGADNAKRFWRKAISSFTDNNYSEEEADDPYWGLVTKQVFISA